MYTWDVPVTIDGADAYYFTDGNFAPKDAKLEYLAEDGQWHEVPNVSGLGVTLNQYNTTSFDPITTTKLRMTMNPKTLGIGVIEWKVYGYGEFVDRSALKSAIATAKGINTNLFVEGSKYLLDLAIAKAQAVLSDTSATQEQVDAAAAELNAVIAGLESADGNLAYSAAVTTSFCSSWESVSAVNDGIVRSNSYNPSKPRYGTWGNTSSYETVTYTWGSEVIIDSTDLYLWYDGTEGEYTSGGILVPKSVEFEYLDAEGNWKSVPNAEGLGREMDKFNKTTFDPFTTTALRVKLNKQANDYNGVGIMEWKVYGKVAGGDTLPTAVKVVIARIDAIGEVTLDSKDAIEAARAAYDKLTDEQKKLVPNYETLTKAEETYAALADAAAVKEVEDLIDAIGEVDENSKEAIEAARAAYDALPTRLQPEVSNYDKLVKAEKDYTDLLTAVEAAQKAAEDARKSAEDAKSAAELAMQAAEQSNKEAAASAAQAAEYAKKMAEAYEEIVRIKAELVEYLAKAQAEAERAEAERKAAEEAQRKAEEAALAAAKYAAAYELAQLQQNGEGLTGHAKEAYDKALADAAAAIEAAKTPAEVDAALAAAREALNNAVCPSAAFTDVEENVWYHDGIDFMVRNGYMNGVAADTFDVEGSLTRAQLVTILFADVADGQWYTKAIVWAAENGIVKGVNETTFAPNDPITREQIAVILYRYAHEENTEDGKLTSFPDAKDISGYALEAMNWAVARGLINGSDGKLLPQDTATRAQIAVILARYLNA